MIQIIILLFVAGSVSCGTRAIVAENVTPTSGNSEAASGPSDSKKPSEVVKEFMALVSAGDVVNAKALLTVEQPAETTTPPTRKESGSIKSGYEVPATLDWATVFHERQFRLGKIQGENIDGNMAEVNVELRVNDLKAYKQDAAFHLYFNDGHWLISDIDFVLEKPTGGDASRGRADLDGVSSR